VKDQRIANPPPTTSRSADRDSTGSGSTGRSSTGRSSPGSGSPGHGSPGSSSPGRDSPGRGSPARVLAALSLAVLGTALAQGGEQRTQPPIVGLHYQELLSGQDDEIVITIPKPALSHWDSLTVVSDDPCLQPDLSRLENADQSWRIPAQVAASGTCQATVTLSVAKGEQEWAAAVLVGVQWVQPDIPSVDGRTASMGYAGRSGPGTMVGADLGTEVPFIEATLTNFGSEPITALGFSTYPLLNQIMGPTFLAREEGGLVEYVEVPAGDDLGTLAPGEALSFGVPIDLEGRLVTGAVAVTLGTLPMIDMGGQRYRLTPQSVYTFEFGPLGR